MENNFSVDTSKQVKRDFLKRIKIPLGIALFLTGIETIVAIIFITKGFSVLVWNEIGICEFVKKCLHYLSTICVFVSLIVMIFNAKPFSHTFTICIRIISSLYFLGAILLPRVPGFETNYEIFSFNNFTLIDGNSLIRALLLYVFSVIIYEGFSMQKDMEETI